jgi:PIN domain nuclease of toxin-antitoxin system
MRYLIDTNIFIFVIQNRPERLSPTQRDILSNAANDLYVSESSLYEIAIKVRQGKQNFGINLETIEEDRKKNGIKLLKPTIAHYLNIPNVPKVLDDKGKSHADPFDLLIISQALSEEIAILSTDRYFPEYAGLMVVE